MCFDAADGENVVPKRSGAQPLTMDLKSTGGEGATRQPESLARIHPKAEVGYPLIRYGLALASKRIPEHLFHYGQPHIDSMGRQIGAPAIQIAEQVATFPNILPLSRSDFVIDDGLRLLRQRRQYSTSGCLRIDGRKLHLSKDRKDKQNPTPYAH
jgi:hypothetical protein